MQQTFLATPRKFTIAFIFVICLLLLISCGPSVKPVFPALSYSDENPSTPESSKEDVNPIQTITSGKLTVSLPLSKDVLHYLTLLFIGKDSGLFTEVKSNNNGFDINLADLDVYSTIDLEVTLKDSNQEGYTVGEIQIMNLARTLPDIFLVKDTSSLYVNGIMPLDLSGDYLNDYLKPTHIYPQMFINETDHQRVASIPYYAKVKMLYMNQNLWVNTQVDPSLFIDSPLNFDSIQILSSFVTNSETNTYAWMNMIGLSTFLPSSIKPFPGSYLTENNQINFGSDAFFSSVELMRQLTLKGYVLDELSENDIHRIYGDNNPISLNKIGFWTDYSTQLENWISSANGNIIRRYPLPVVDKINIPLSTIQIVVNPACNIPNVARNLAIFLALDTDALLFKGRYNNPNGYIPPIQDPLVWEKLVMNQLQGSELFLLHEFMDDSHVIYMNDNKKVADTFKELYNKYIYDILYRNVSPENKVETLNKEVNILLNG